MSERLMDLVLLMFSLLIIRITVGYGTCSAGCVSCINDTCMKCEVGNYLESGSCYTCPAHCTSCNNSGVCYNCTEGYYGLSCQENCISSMCLNNTCSQYSGACVHGCIEGYYLYGLLCYPCGANCKTCANYNNNCLQCKEGYYGPSCHYLCSRCKDGICTRDKCTYGCDDGFFREGESCNPCNKHCASCSHYSTCQVCENGYFGPACQFTCSECSPCNQNGSCPETTLRPLAPVITLISSLPTKSKSSRTVTSTTTRPQPPTTTDYIVDRWYQQKQTMDSTIKYAVGGGVAGFFVVTMIVFVVCVTNRRSRIKQTIMRLNCRGIESDGASQDYTTLAMKSREDDSHLYSGLDNPDNTVSMETSSTTCEPSGLETHNGFPQRQTGDIVSRIYINVT